MAEKVTVPNVPPRVNSIDLLPNQIYGAGCNPSKTDADKTEEDDADVEPHPVKSGGQNPTNMSNLPQQEPCKCIAIGIAVIIAAMLVMALIFVGIALYLNNNARDVQKPTQAVDTTHTSVNPVVNTSVNPVVNTSVNPVVNTSVNPVVNTSVNPVVNTSVNPVVNTSVNPVVNTYVNPVVNTYVNPVVNTTYTSFSPVVDTPDVSDNPDVDTPHTPHKPGVDTTYTPNHPAIYITYTPFRAVAVLSSTMPPHSTILPLEQTGVEQTGVEHEVSTNGVTEPASFMQKEAPKMNWRKDLRCGGRYTAENGKPAKCNPDGTNPCCSPGNWCGSSQYHCTCLGCVDYRKGKGL
ncbi:hypothetical protein Bbelb_154940 [Branchiostoma belcheri]|nr:hypothetical protein Bbelb_154940 [Branchiostoma belcheri]